MAGNNKKKAPSKGKKIGDKTPIEDKKFRKGTPVYWLAKVGGVYRRIEGVVKFTVRKGNKPDKEFNKLNKKMARTRNINAYHKNETRPLQSFIVAVKDKEGKDVLHWPKLSKLERRV